MIHKQLLIKDFKHLKNSCLEENICRLVAQIFEPSHFHKKKQFFTCSSDQIANPEFRNLGFFFRKFAVCFDLLKTFV